MDAYEKNWQGRVDRKEHIRGQTCNIFIVDRCNIEILWLNHQWCLYDLITGYGTEEEE